GAYGARRAPAQPSLAPLVVVDAAGARPDLPPDHPRDGGDPARRRARGRARPPDAARAGEGAVSYVDAHHHIWRMQDLPWLSGPMIPRIFGPYDSLRGDYDAAAYGAEVAKHGFNQSVYVQANWPLDKSVEEVEWVHSQHEEHGWPDAI